MQRSWGRPKGLRENQGIQESDWKGGVFVTSRPPSHHSKDFDLYLKSKGRRFEGLSKGEWASWESLVVKNLPANAGDKRDMSSIPGSGRSPGGGNDNPLQYSCLENPWTEESGRLWSIW